MWTEETRPEIGAIYEGFDGEQFEVMSIWENGTVLKQPGGKHETMSADTFLEHLKPVVTNADA
jgi:hypothetical protein